MLIADDDDDVRELCAVCMRENGWHVIEAINGAEAVAIAATNAPDVVVLDVTMPVLDGREAIRLLRADARTAEVRTVACTGHTGPEVAAELRAEGFDAVLTKPFSPDDLSEALERLLRA